MRPNDPQGNPSADEAITAVSQVAYGFMGSQALFAALDLGLFTALETGPMEAEALANKIGAQLDPLRSLLEACLALGLVIREGESYPQQQGRLALSGKRRARLYGRLLSEADRRDALPSDAGCARGLARARAPPPIRISSTIPVRTEAFIRGQHAGSAGPAYLLSRNPDLANYKCLLDLGGGSGAFSIEAVRRNPNLSAIVFDQPQVIAFAKKFIAEEGFEDRIRCVSGDVVKDEWPPAAT